MGRKTKTKEDLTGKRFGKWTVIEQADDICQPSGQYHAAWLCQCDCGSEPKIVSGNVLKRGFSKSCGCISKRIEKVKVREDLTGKRFGRLLVLEQAEDRIMKDGTPKPQWKCLCDCGNIKIALGMSLKKGTTQSCGCLAKELASKRAKILSEEKFNNCEDLTGFIFGRWTVISRAEDYIFDSGVRSRQWLCECSCEKHTKRNVLEGNLKNGSSKSCGCLASEATSERNKKYNEYDLSGEYGIGYTLKGEEFWFDLEDYDKIKDYCWFYTEDYVCAYDKKLDKLIQLHNLVMDTPNDIIVDHIKHSKRKTHKIDNRKSNLRFATKSQNMMNRHIQSNNTSGTTGVSFDKRRNKWRAYIKINRETISLGYYKDKEDAINARKKGEEKYFGQYSFDNSLKLNEDIDDIKKGA